MTEECMDTLRVGIVGGARLPGNVETFLTNVRELLADYPIAFDCDLLLSETVDAPDGFTVVDPGLGEPGRALDRLRTLTAALTRYARETPVDVLFQVTKFPLHGCATAVAGWRTDTPVLGRFAGDNFREYHFSNGVERARTFGLNNVIGRVPVHFTDQIIVLGPHGRREIMRWNRHATVVEIPQPIEMGKFSPVSPERERELASELGLPSDERVFLTVGRLTERKGVPDIVEVAAELSSRGAEFRWYVIGDGPLRSRLEAAPDVEPLGRVPHDEIPEYYRAADLLVHPSLIEGLPNVLLEAAAVGLPSVARDVGDCALAASTVFTETDRLPELMMDEHQPVELGDRFSADWLCERYGRTLVETAKQKR